MTISRISPDPPERVGQEKFVLPTDINKIILKKFSQNTVYNPQKCCFISKIKGLQQHGYEVILFVNHQKSEFDLCKVKSVPVNRGFGLIKSVLSFLILIITKPATIRKFIKYEKKVGIGFNQVVKKVFLHQHIFRTLNLDWLHFGFATQAIG